MPTDTLVILCVDAICVVAVVVAFVRGKPGFVVPLAEAVVILPVSLLGVFGMGLIDQLQYTGHIPTQPAPVENLIELTAAFIGVVALWTALLVPPSWWARLPIVATLIVAGLFAGIVVSARFIAEWHQLGYGTVTNPAAYILFLPVLVAVHQAVRIARHLMCKTRIARA
ncbi:hypothetical protein H8N03_14090 [Ramlibacter sp. USB13]|uniref:Uncharacterized protein n=1 Tax=Ramlibacter cellulosilyticus TaxID=2764187 RepID=A0A923SCB8_9BURK|nr:hypothetical protein [Ramlibacter cellulosilyticus]MBC5784078.1 hypothetical protein [Ramlibacter cellulosilyticus]